MLLSVCLLVCMCVGLSCSMYVCLLVCMCLGLYVSLYVSWFVLCWSVCVFVCMCVGLYVCLFVYVFVCMSVCLYVSLSVCGCLTMQSSALQHAGENMHPWNGVLANGKSWGRQNTSRWGCPSLTFIVHEELTERRA